MSNRTPTPSIDRIWNRHATTKLWHQLWIHHLQLQTDHNPHHPGHQDIDQYIQAAERYTNDGIDNQITWHTETDRYEQTTRHDLAAALQNYNDHAGADTAHLGFTSHDITDLTTQIQIRRSLNHIIDTVDVLTGQLSRVVTSHATQPLVARTHGQPAQLTTYGHRIATTIGPLLSWIDRAQAAYRDYPMRPPNGAVGTGADLLRVLNGWPADPPGTTLEPPVVRRPAQMSQRYRDVLVEQFKNAQVTVGVANTMLVSLGLEPIDGQTHDVITGCPRCGSILNADATGCTHSWHAANQKLPRHNCAEKRDALIGSPADTTRCGCDNPTAANLEQYTWHLANLLGFRDTMPTTRQIYHRSYDLPIASLMVELASIAETWAADRRLEAMLGLGNEQREPGQIGSSAMAHKTNPVLAERICGLAALTRGHYTTLASMGSGWMEGDVSTSSTRREVLPAMFANIAAILINWADANERWQLHAAAMTGETQQYQKEMATGVILQWLVEHGISRADAHAAIRDAHPNINRLAWQDNILNQAGLNTTGNRDALKLATDNLAHRPIGDVDAQITRVVALVRGGDS